MLVHLVITSDRIVADFDLFIPTQPMPEQAQIPTRKITAIIYPAPQKPEPAVQIKSIHISAPNRPSDFAFQLGRDAFVGIDNQHPLMLPANIFQSPVFLPW